MRFQHKAGATLPSIKKPKLELRDTRIAQACNLLNACLLQDDRKCLLVRCRPKRLKFWNVFDKLVKRLFEIVM
jgi:hypothetical protein